MDSDLTEFIAHLDDDVPFSPYPKLNEIWRDLEDYFDRSYFNIDEYLDELLPSAKPVAPTVENDIFTNEPQMMNTEKFFQSFAIPETFFNNLIIHSPPLKGQNVVTTQLLLDSVRTQNFSFTGSKCEHPFEVLATSCASSVPPVPRKDFSADIETTVIPSMSSNVQWLSVLHKQIIRPCQTVEAMVTNILKDESTILLARTEIVKVVQKIFTDLNSYIDCLSIEFSENKFFDSPHFYDLSEKMQEKILLHSNLKGNDLRDVLVKWMGMVTEWFADFNDKRRQVEEKVSKTIIDKAVEIYRSRLMSLNLDGDKSIECKKESDIILEGIRHAYAKCGETFIANLVSQLEKRLRDPNSSPTNKPTISPLNATSTASDGLQVVIDLLVSEYASNIKQKGLQCAGISTIKQFDDVNGRCLKDIWHDFDRRMKNVAFAEQNELKEELSSKLNSESDCKRAEFKRSIKAVIPTVVSSARSHSIGIHFGFETFSVSYYDRVNDSFRTIYGPVANVVSFTRDGISIGLIPADGLCLNMDNLLTTLNVDRVYDTPHDGKLKLLSIIALMLMYTHEIVQETLHLQTISEIKYTVAIPSCLNGVVQSVFETAFNLARIDCNLIREQCALTTNFVRENHQTMVKNNDEFVVAMIVNEKNASDRVVYDITGVEHGSRMIKISSAGGSKDNSRLFGFIGKTGVESEVDKIQSKHYKQNRFLICCNDHTGVCKQMKIHFTKSKFHPFKLNSNRLAEGAALLSYIAVNGTSSLGYLLDLRNLTSIKRSSSVRYRLEHTTHASDSQNLQELSAQLRRIIDTQLSKIAECKAATKQLIVGKMKDMEEDPQLTNDEKEQYRLSLQNDLKAMDDELMSKRVVQSIAENWQKNQF